jgi:hypothetical protein
MSDALPAARPGAGVMSTYLGDEAIVLHVGTKRYYRLNPTAAVFWEGMEKGLSHDALLDRACVEFTVDRDEADRELRGLLLQLEAELLVGARLPSQSGPS